MEHILVTGANGQIGSELVEHLLRERLGKRIVCADLQKPDKPVDNAAVVYENLDVTNREKFEQTIERHRIDTIFHLVGILSARGERNPELAWNVNVNSLKYALDFAHNGNMRVFWPSSIAVFGPTSPKQNTPQETVLEPTSMYGVTKVTGELLCNYYFHKYGVDVRSMRFPGLISYKTPPGGGTTDYAVEIFYAAVAGKSYRCYLSADTVLPMMYMDDAIRAIFELMAAPAERIRVRTSYNITAVSFSVAEIAGAIARQRPQFRYSCEPDYRQNIADSWPSKIDDSRAREHWGWQHRFDLSAIVETMLANVRPETTKA